MAAASSSAIAPYRKSVSSNVGRAARRSPAGEVLAGEGEPLGKETGQQDQPVRDLAGQLEGPRAARGDVDGRLGDGGAEMASREPPGPDLALDRFAAPQASHGVDRVSQRLQLRHRQPELVEGSIADPDAAGHPTRGKLLERAEGVGRDRRMARQWIRDCRSDGDARRRLQRERRVDVAVARVHRRVGEPEVVEAEVLDPLDELDPFVRLVDALQRDAVAHHQTTTLRPRTWRARSRSRAVSISASG